MKILSLFLAASFLVPTFARAQALPDNPTPAPTSDPAWERVRSLAPNEAIVVRNDNGSPVHCLFSAATDGYLFCDPPGNPPGVGFRFDRARVVSVDLDLPSQTGAQFTVPPERNYHPAWLSSIIAGGLIVGIIASRTTDAGSAAQAGAIAAGVVGLIGAPLAFLPRPAAFAGNDPLFPQFRAGVPLPHLCRPHLHLLPRNEP
jgi:hypothetical protein